MSPSTQRKRAERRCGFTLLEMVAAIVLMTILFAALTSLLRGFAEQRRALDRIADANPATQQLADLLRRDFINAQTFRSERRQLVLVGNLAQDREARTPTGLRAEVTYKIERLAEEDWLVRREVNLDNASTQRTTKQLVWQGVTGIEVISPGGDDSKDSDEVVIPGMSMMPARLRLVLLRDENLPLLDPNVLHHWEDS